MRVLSVLVFALLTAPALAGCLYGEGATDEAAGDLAGTAEQAGLTAGPAPSAPTGAYAVTTSDNQRVVAHPVILPTNAPKAPVSMSVEGVFETKDCLSLNGGVARSWQEVHLSEHIQPGDVFNYVIRVTLTNKDTSWADIYPGIAIGARDVGHPESIRDKRGPVTMTWEGQSYRRSADDPAYVWLLCWYGAVTDPIPYKVEFELTFAGNAVPAETPFLLKVPENATRLIVRGVPVDPTQGVLSHYRLFAPDDSLVCECVLSSGADTAILTLPPGGGDYVILVDHTSNGFVSVALDAPSPEPLVALEAKWVRHRILTSEGGQVDETVPLDLPKVPLAFWVYPAAGSNPDVGAGRNVKIVVTGPAGEAASMTTGTFGIVRAPGVNQFLPLTTEGWSGMENHHAFAPGPHTIHVTAEHLRGSIILEVMEYVRPGEDA